MISAELSNALHQMVKKFRPVLIQFHPEVEALISPEAIITAACQAIQGLMTTNASLQEEIVDLKYDLESNDGYTKDLRQTHKALQAEYQSVNHQLKRTKMDLENEQAKREAAEAELQRLQFSEEEEEEIYPWFASEAVQQKSLSKSRLSLKADLRELQVEIKQMREDQDRKKDLVKVGIDVRLRFLEQAKERLSSQKKAQMNTEILEIGNRAAHSGCGEADGSLFILGVIPEHSLASLTGIYKDLYHNDPSTFNSSPPELREVVNHEVTIRTLQTLNFGLDRPILERQRTMEHIEIVVNKCVKLKDEVLIAGDADIARRVALVREGIATIVELDRRQSRPLSLKENQRSNTSYRRSGRGSESAW